MIYINGKIIPNLMTKISVFDHGLLYGDGVFEGLRSYNGKIFKVYEHINRLYDSAKAIDLKIPLSRFDMRTAISQTLQANNLKDAYIRVIVTRGEGDMGINPKNCSTPNIIIITLPQKSGYPNIANVIISATRRNPTDVLSPNIKSLSYLNNIMARIEANHKGADEAIILDTQGNVSEGSADNVFIVKNDVLITPPTLNNLNGITRNAIIDLAEGNIELGIMEFQEKNISMYDLYTADEIFITGTFIEIVPVGKIDGRVINDGKIGQYTKKLMDAFKSLVS